MWGKVTDGGLAVLCGWGGGDNDVMLTVNKLVLLGEK